MTHYSLQRRQKEDTMNKARAIRNLNVKSGSQRQYRKFPLDRIAKLWSAKKTIAQITRAIGRFDEKNPVRSLHAVRNCLRRMHKGYMDGRGNFVKLPHRVAPKTVRACRKAGYMAA
jgi:hypothetical protein